MKDEKDPGTKDAFPLSNAERQRKSRVVRKNLGKATLVYLDPPAQAQLKKLKKLTGMTQEHVINWLLHLAAQHDKTPKT